MRPDEVELRELYENQRLSTVKLAAHYGVARISVNRWLRRYGIERRPNGRGLANRGVEPPTPERLTQLVHEEHRSYREVAALFGVDGSAVQHWLERHGIPQPTVWETRYGNAAPALPTREELEALLLAGVPVMAVARDRGVSPGSITRLCRRYGFKIRLPGWTNVEWPFCADGHRVRSTYERRVDDWLSEHGIAHMYEPPLPFDRRYRADFLANSWYIEIWGVTKAGAYQQRRARKVALYRAHRAPLIQLMARDFWKAARGRWARKLRSCLTAPPAGALLLPHGTGGAQLLLPE